MGTPAQNLQTILAYWEKATKDKNNTWARDSEGPRALYDAAHAMRELIKQCALNPYVRETVWAQSPIFQRALLVEPFGYTDWLLKNTSKIGQTSGSPFGGNIAAANAAAMFDTFGHKPLRLIMLEGIHSAATGGFFNAADPSGIASWLQSSLIMLGAALGGGGMKNAIEADDHPYVRAAALKIVRDLAIPAVWLDVLLGSKSGLPGADRAQDGAILKLKAQIPVSGWDPATRVALSVLSDQALARCLQIVKDEETQALMAYALPSGQGSWPMSKAPPKRWYKRGDLISASAIGLVVGIATHRRRTLGA